MFSCRRESYRLYADLVVSLRYIFAYDCVLGIWSDLDKTWQRDREWKSEQIFFGEIAPGASEKGAEH